MTLATEARWRGKILAKIVLSRLPISHRTWRRIGIFRFGEMLSGPYVLDVFRRAFERSGLDHLRGLNVMELGPGDSLFSAVLARAAGAAGSVHVDVGVFADEAVDRYRAFAQMLGEHGYEVVDLSSARTLGEVLELCHAQYLTCGLESLRRLRSASVDFTWSQSTIEHVRAGELDSTARELRRVMSPDGVAVHLIDLRDHLADGLNHLRFSERRWESPLMANSGFYTNRLRLSALTGLFEAAGFRCEVVKAARWRTLPITRARMAEPFRSLPESDLLVHTAVLRLKAA